MCVCVCGGGGGASTVNIVFTPRLFLCLVFRNSRGSDKIFVYRYNRLYPFFKTLYEAGSGELPEVRRRSDTVDLC